MKKFVSGILALATVAVTAVSSVASAAGSFIPGKDPNGDGVLTLADSVYIRQVLGGKFNPSDLSQLDVDDNYVVSMADVVMAQRAEIGIYSASEMENADSPMNAAASSTSASYRVYNAKTGAYKRQYSLSVENDNNAVETYSLPPYVDNKVVDWSNRGVAKLMCAGGYIGSGFVVGKHTIATAAHCVFETVNNNAYKFTEILLFDENGNPTSFTPVESHVPSSYYNYTEYHSVDDYALITVKEDLTDYMSFGVGMLREEATNKHIEVSAVGFTQNAGNDAVSHIECLTTGEVNSVTNDKIIWHSAYISPGNSGGPLYVTETVAGQTYYTVVGINSGYTGFETKSVNLVPEVLKFLVGNTNLQY